MPSVTENRFRVSGPEIEVARWGLVEYPEAVERQLTLVEEVASGRSPEQVVITSHPPVVTVGRFRGGNDLLSWNGPVVESSRGGRATYHGPNQIVVYPIIDLRRENRAVLRPRDVGQYLRLLADATAEVLQESGAAVEVRQGYELDEEGQRRELTGVWYGARKVASIGVAVKRWITYHGVAINLDHDPRAFAGIRPCGFATGTMISVEEIVDRPLDRELMSQKFAERIISFCRS